MYWFPFRQRRPEKAIGVHIQLTGALLFLHLSFLLCSHWVLLLTVDEEDWVCKGLGLWLHWSLLATISWTALEGFHIYLLLVRVFNIYVRRYMLKISLVGWGEWSLLLCQMCKCFCMLLFTYNVLGDLKIPSLHSSKGTCCHSDVSISSCVHFSYCAFFKSCLELLNKVIFRDALLALKQMFTLPNWSLKEKSRTTSA